MARKVNLIRLPPTQFPSSALCRYMDESHNKVSSYRLTIVVHLFLGSLPLLAVEHANLVLVVELLLIQSHQFLVHLEKSECVCVCVFVWVRVCVCLCG